MLLFSSDREAQRGCSTCQQPHRGAELDLEAGQPGCAPDPDRQPGLGGGGVSSQARGPAVCPPHGAASSPGHCDICPASWPQTAAQSHVSTSTGEPGNWLWPLDSWETRGAASLDWVALREGDPLSPAGAGSGDLGSLSFPARRSWGVAGLGRGSEENAAASWVDRVQTFPFSQNTWGTL